jgi:methanogenic corrinoid protein MtbC1
VYDLGVDTPGDKIIGKALEVNADIIAMSALLTTTMVKQREVIEELEKEGLRTKVKVMVGGAPVTRDWVTAIGADGYSEDAIGAVMLAKKLMGTE